MNANNRNQSRPAPRNARPEDPTNTAALPNTRSYSREDLEKIFAASNAVLGLEPELRPSFGGVHRVMALARTALVIAGARAEEAEANGMLPGSAWAQARDLRALVFSLGVPKTQNEQRQA